ncbi:hypothetical protein [Amycolatopsis sp. NPDC059021]|uniref:hypothetical protein n=1 Tax=Amycolatopsis sp. NPDC059021 TaxID=3346704 RepID=UPI00366E1ABF
MNDGGIRSEAHLAERALESLRTLLGPEWAVDDLSAEEVQPDADRGFDVYVRVTPPDGRSPHVDLLIATKSQVTPSAAENQIVPVNSILRHTKSPHVLVVVAPWISERTQRVLRDRGIGYLDLTGNVWLSVAFPSIHLYTQGDRKAPRGGERGAKTVTLSGPRAGRVVRFLVDFAPPYRATDIAEAAEVSLPWVSRLLTQLQDQLLIRREGRVVVDVDWQGLLHARAGSYDLLRHNPHIGTLAPNGIAAVLEKLRELPLPDQGKPRAVVTGPYAAQEVAPLTSGGQLMLYVGNESQAPDELAGDLGLIRVDERAEVLLLRSHDDIVFEGYRTLDGIAHVAYSQLVLDGLAGPGRMPAEAEAVLAYMSANEKSWRRRLSRTA